MHRHLVCERPLQPMATRNVCFLRYHSASFAVVVVFPCPYKPTRGSTSPTRLEVVFCTEDTNKFEIENVHGMCLKIDARPFFFSHALLKTINNFLGLSYVKVNFCKARRRLFVISLSSSSLSRRLLRSRPSERKMPRERP